MTKLFWAKEKVFEVAKKYKYKKDFRKNDSQAYQSAIKKQWIVEMTWFEKTKSYREKTVLQYSLNGEFIKEWPSVKSVEKQLEYSKSSIGQCCRGERKTAYGFVWKYKKR